MYCRLSSKSRPSSLGLRRLVYRAAARETRPAAFDGELASEKQARNETVGRERPDSLRRDADAIDRSHPT